MTTELCNINKGTYLNELSKSGMSLICINGIIIVLCYICESLLMSMFPSSKLQTNSMSKMCNLP